MSNAKTVSAVVVVLVIGLVVGMSLVVRQWTDKPRAADSVFNLSAAMGNIEPVGAPVPPNPTLLRHGEWVYRGLCIGCHGIDGDGNGAVWELADVYAPEHKLPRKPRDFTQAVFKLRSTPSGSFPTDVDLFRSISRGLVADYDMPSFKYLPERDRWAVIAYVKTLSPRWEEEAEWQEDPITVAEPPLPDDPMLVAGKGVYERMQCAECHGPLGKGDGPSAPGLEDDSGLQIVPRDFTDAAQFVGDSSPRGVYQTFTTGLDGTPMPSFADFLDEDQRWQLVWYVTSLRPDWDTYTTRVNLLKERGEDVALAALTPVAAPAPAAAQEAEPAAPASGAVEGAVVVAAATARTGFGGQGSAGDTGTATVQEEAEPAAQGEPARPVFLDKYQEVGVSDGGTIQGKIVFNGAIKKKTILPTKDKRVCGKVRKEPLILVGDGGAVKDSIVYLKGVESGKAWPEMLTKIPVLDQKGCQFQPNVQVARQGSLDIINSDPVLHNTHGYYGKRTAFNVALPEKDQKVTKVLKSPGTVKVDCDAHGWMLGWVQVVDNPYFFQTGDDGTFSIADVPPGDHTLVAWQEWLGETEIPVSVRAGETTELDIDLTK